MKGAIVVQQSERYEELFEGYDKASAFDQIAKLFFDRNFGTATKSEIELLMFHFYMDALIKKHKAQDGVLDYTASSDYNMGKQLGLPQTTVRTLKVKAQARYPERFDWMKSLASIQSNIRQDGRKVIIPVRDVNLLLEIKNYIVEHGGYIEFESTGEFLKIRIEYFLMLMYETLEIEDKKKFVKEMKKRLQDNDSEEHAFEHMDRKQLLEDVISATSGSLSIITAIVDMLNPQNALVKLFLRLFPTH